MSLLSESKAWMLRNIYDRDCGVATEFWEIINDTPHSIEDLPSKVRNQVRRSHRDCEFRIISAQELVDSNGYEVYSKSFERYRDVVSNIPTRQNWESGILKSSEYEFWGVFKKDNGQLIAWAMNSTAGDCVNYNTLKAIPELMNKHYPYFGLLFEMNRYYLEERKFGYVSDGMRSITEHSNIQPFLEKNFLFRKAYCRLAVYYKPWLKFCITIAYPFKKFIPLKSFQYLLNLEKIRRGCY